MTERINFISGKNPIREALKAHKVLKIYISNSFKDSEISLLCENQKIPMKLASSKELDSYSNGVVHQGICAEIKPYQYSSLEELLYRCQKVDNPIIVILDGINDPHNFGAIIRTAEIFNVQGVIVSKHNQVPLNATVAKTSVGAINFVPVVSVNNINQTIDVLKENGFWIVSSDGSAKDHYDNISYDFKTALIIGSEGYGISKLTLKKSDYIVKIPMYGTVNSLNASVAAGILISEVKKWTIRKAMNN